METVTLSSKGQLVIPKQVRMLANLSAGDEVQVRFLEGEIRLRPVTHAKATRLDEVAGCLSSAAQKPGSDAQVHAAIKARLKAEDTATMGRPRPSSKSST